MRRTFPALLGLFLCATSLSAGGSEGKIILETWDAAYLQGGKSGYVQTTVRQISSGGKPHLRTTMKLRLKVKRFNEVISLAMDTGTVETKDGKVTGVFMQQPIGKNKTVQVTGKVVGNQIRLTLDGTKELKPAPWDERVLGLYRQQKIFQKRKVKPGDEFAYYSFEPSINLVVKTNVKVTGYETVELFGGKSKKRLLHVQTKPGPVQGVQLPKMDLWLDDNLETVRSEVNLPIGKMTLYRTSKADATKAGSVVSLTDIGTGQLIKLNKRIINPYATKKALYRLRIKGSADPAKAIAKDARQSVGNVQGNSLLLAVSAGPSSKEVSKPGDEFIQSSYFINSEDVQVKKLARKAVGSEKSPLKKAVRIEKWVNRNMKGRNHEAMATADHVAKTLEGDCSEFAMLMAAMCRAEGIPSKTAMGLIYAEVAGKGPVFSFHMWTEVWIDGQWIPLDATLGRGYVGAAHIKIADHSWHETRTLTPVLPLYTLLGKISVEVVKVE